MFGMRLNPSKCTFGVSAEKFLGFMLTSRGIEANPDKCRAILEMQSPRNLKELQRLLGRLTSLSHFIPKLAKRIKPIVKIMKKDGRESGMSSVSRRLKRSRKSLLTHRL